MTELENTTRTYFAPAQMTPEGLWVDGYRSYHFHDAQKAWEEVDSWNSETKDRSYFVVQVTETRKITRINRIRDWQPGEQFLYENDVWEVTEENQLCDFAPQGEKAYTCFEVSDPDRGPGIVFSSEMEEIE